MILAEPVDHHDWTAREPMVVQHPNGTLFVTGYAGGAVEQRPLLWASRDNGATWTRIEVGPVGTPADRGSGGKTGRSGSY